MKFIINTSFLPYFCAIFDDQANLIDRAHWEDGRQSGPIIWNFTEKHKLRTASVDFIGAVSGPGGFSHLRSSAVILNTLSFYFKIPMHQARADLIITEFLENQLDTCPQFALNSFGKGLFIPGNQDLERFLDQELLSMSKKDQIPTWVNLLPDEKKAYFPNKIDKSLSGIENSTLKSLQKQTPSQVFIPDYEYPAVQA